MRFSWNWIIPSLSLVASMSFQLLSPQAFYISLIIFLVFFTGNLIAIALTRSNIKQLFKDPILRSLVLFLLGTSVVSLFTSCCESYKETQNQKERQDLFTDYLSQRTICDIALDQLQREHRIPSYEWCDSVGIKKELQDLVCGVFYMGMDYSKARHYLKKASKDIPLAAYLYGEFVYMGLGDIPNKEDGLPLIVEAAEKQVLDAQYRLLGMNILSNNLHKSEIWFQRIIHAQPNPSVDIHFDKGLLIDAEDEYNDTRNRKVFEENLKHVFYLMTESFNIIIGMQLKAKKPYAAISICDDYLHSSFIYQNYNRKELNEFMDHVRYTIYVETGNKLQANKIAPRLTYHDLDSYIHGPVYSGGPFNVLFNYIQD